MENEKSVETRKMSRDSSVVVSKPFVVHMWIDSSNLPDGRICQHPDITPGRDENVYNVMNKYLEDHGLSQDDVIVFYGKPTDGKYSVMGWHTRDHTFGNDRWHYKQGDTMTIGLRGRTGMYSAEDLKVRVCFVEEDEPHDLVFTGSSYCFELLQSVFELALSHLNMEAEAVTFSNRGNVVDGTTMTAHELFTGNGLAKGDALTIAVKYKRATVEVRVVSDDCVFRQVRIESPLRRISAICTDVAISRGLIIEACTFEVCNWLMTSYRKYQETVRLTDIGFFPLETRHVLRITGGSKRDLEKLAVAATVQAAGHKRALEAHEQRARILEAQADRDIYSHAHTVDVMKRHYEEALHYQKRVNKINAKNCSDQAALVADAAASLEQSERKRARFEAVLAAFEEESVAKAVEERVCLGECVVCLEKMFLGDNIMRLNPCGHTKVCVGCIPGTVNLNVCPVCRTEILGTDPVFL